MKNKGIAIVSALIGFAGGWVAKCFQIRKTGRTIHEVTETKTDISKVEKPVPVEAEVSEPDVFDDVDILNYSDLTESYAPVEEPEEPKKPKGKFPYMITDEEYEEENGFTKRHLTFYLGDGVLADEENREIDNWRELVGIDSLTRMETFGERMQLVRNEILKEDYEILLNEDFFEKDDGR